MWSLENFITEFKGSMYDEMGILQALMAIWYSKYMYEKMQKMSDIMRLVIMHVHGGMYMDVDIVPLTKHVPHDWLTGRSFTLEWEARKKDWKGAYIVQNCWFMSPKSDHILMDALKRIPVTSTEINQLIYGEAPETTGP